MILERGIIHGTTQWAASSPDSIHWSQGNRCPLCEDPITNHAELCKSCHRQVQVNREKFKRRRDTMTDDDVLALTAWQMERVREKLGEWKEAGDE